MKSFATRHDFKNAITQLKKSTKVVEGIKNQLNEKYWVKQQIWDAKRTAYEEILNSLYLTRKYINREKSYTEDYFECYVVLGSGCMSGDEEYMNSYAEYVESERNLLHEKYDSEEAVKKRKELSEDTHESYVKLETIFNVKSLYLDPDIKGIESSLADLREKIFNTKFSERQDEDTEAFLERVMVHNNQCLEVVDSIILKTKELAANDLLLAAD